MKTTKKSERGAPLPWLEVIALDDELAERTQCASPHFSFLTFFADLPDFVTRFHSKKVGFLTRFRLTIEIFDPYLDPFDLYDLFRRLVCLLTYFDLS